MILDRRTLLSGAFALAASPALASETSTAEAALAAVFDGYQPVSLGAAVIGKSGVTWSGVRGVRRFGQADPVSIRDRWHLGSNTKAMTAALYARLVEQGRARWDAPLAELFPGVAIDAGWAERTVEDFMHHRAGLSDATAMGGAWLQTARFDGHSLPDQRAALVAAFLSVPPAGTPGDYQYANGNYVLVGAAIERLTGGSWEDVMTSEVFTPLGMASAGFGPPLTNADGGPNAWAHYGSVGGRMPLDPHGVADNPLALGPAGTVHATLEDYGRFLAVFLNDGGEWLSPDSMRRLTTPAPGAPPAYACGWGVAPAQPWSQGPMLGHEGSNTLWHAVALLAPTRGVGLVTVTNEGLSNPAPNRLVTALVETLT